MPNAWDLYPDLLIYKAKLFANKKAELDRLNESPRILAPVVLCELKFTSSFPSLQRAHLLKDAIKLSLIAEFMTNQGYQTPRLVQAIFNFPHPRHNKTEDTFVGWYQEEEFMVNAKGVEAFMIFKTGRIVELTKEWNRK